MPRYAYTAMDARGRRIMGILAAANPLELETRLGRQGLDLIKSAPARSGIFGREPGLSRRERLHFFIQLEQLLRAGIPLADALDDLRGEAGQPALRDLLGDLAARIEGGMPLSRAMKAHPRAFDAVAVGLVQAGETSGRLPEMLGELAGALAWQDELAARSRRLLFYPVLLAVVVTAVFLFLLLYLVPQMAGFLLSMGRELPLQTRLLIGLSGAVQRHGLHFAMFLALAGIASWRLRDLPTPRRWTENLLRRLPLLGPIRRKLAVSRIANALALMHEAGIPILDALRSAEAAAGDRIAMLALSRAGEQVAAGRSLTDAFRATELFPPTLLRMVRVGEDSGTLGAALRNVGHFTGRDAREATDRLQAMLEPAMTLILGGLLGWIMLAVLGPVYDNLGGLGG